MTDAKARTVEIVGVPSGPDDGDRHLVVDRKTFVAVTGRDPDADEVVDRKRCRLFWHAMAAPLRAGRKVRVKLSVAPV